MRRRNPLPLFLLFSEIARYGSLHRAPVTLVLLAGQFLLFINPLHDLNEVCISVINVYYRQDYKRMILSTFYHADEWHIYYNMASFLMKGQSLEQQFGSSYFAILIGIFTGITNCILIGLSFLGETYLKQTHYLTDCAVGFSGVLFALKVLTTYNMTHETLIFGVIPIKNKYVVWVELLLIQLISPKASFLGHLAGILTGLLYIYGPLKSMMEVFQPAGQRGRFTDTSEPSGHRYRGQPGQRLDRQQFVRGHSMDYQARDQHHSARRSRNIVNSDDMRERRLAYYGRSF